MDSEQGSADILAGSSRDVSVGTEAVVDAQGVRSMGSFPDAPANTEAVDSQDVRCMGSSRDAPENTEEVPDTRSVRRSPVPVKSRRADSLVAEWRDQEYGEEFLFQSGLPALLVKSDGHGTGVGHLRAALAEAEAERRAEALVDPRTANGVGSLRNVPAAECGRSRVRNTASETAGGRHGWAEEEVHDPTLSQLVVSPVDLFVATARSVFHAL